MAVENLIDRNAFTFPEDATFDLHDIVTILFRERLLSDTRFRRAKLIELSDGSWPASCIPIDNQLAFIHLDAPKVGYFIKLLGGNKDGKDDADGEDDEDVVEPHNFLHESLVTPRELDVEEVENIFWTIKNHDNGYVLPHALQLILDSLPTSATLRVRTHDGYSISCSPRSFTIAEMGLLPKRSVFINAIHPRVEVNGKKQIQMDQYSFGSKWLIEPWVYFVFNEVANKDKDEEVTKKKSKKDDDKSINLDMNVCALGARGTAGELFALTRRNYYHNTILPGAGAFEDLELIESPRIATFPTSTTNSTSTSTASNSGSDPNPTPNPPDNQHANANTNSDTVTNTKPNVNYTTPITLAKRVLTRLSQITLNTQTFCAYCGLKNPRLQCSRCRGGDGTDKKDACRTWDMKVKYCNLNCQKKGWRFHKYWCNNRDSGRDGGDD